MKNIIYICCLSIFVFSCETAPIANTDEIVPNLDAQYTYSQLELPAFLASGLNPGFINQTSVGGVFNNNIGIEVDVNGNFIGNQRVILEINDAQANLGRVLFYDKKLSLNNTVSCGSCHLQSKAFADGLKVSQGFEGRKTTRNSMAILNPILQNNLFWDSRSQSIFQLSLEPVQNHIEMGMEDIDFLSKKLAATSYYPALFEKAFGASPISGTTISMALSQFIASITSANSKFDKHQAGEVQYTAMEQMGQDLFFSDRLKCGSCHAGSNFSAPDGIFDAYGGGGINSISGGNPRGTTNIGLDLRSSDEGLNNGNFKIPSLRNIALTGPYMHDGRFAHLEQVMDHYSEGIKDAAGLDPKFRTKTGKLAPLRMTTVEKHAIIAFLHTLTDEKLITDPKYSDPFSY